MRPNIRRVYIPKPGKTEKRPSGFQLSPTGRSNAPRLRVLSAIYEQDFLPCSFGGRPKLSAHHALATLNEVIAGGMIGWVLEADFEELLWEPQSTIGSSDLSNIESAIRQRLINLIRRWLKAGVLEDGAVHPSEQGTPARWIDQRAIEQRGLPPLRARPLVRARVVKVRLRGEALHLVRYIDDFVICFQYRSDALRVQEALRLRLGKFGLTLEPTKTKLVEFGRFAQKHAGKRGRNRPETIYFLGLDVLYCTRNQRGNFKVGMRTEKSRLKRSSPVSARADAANTAL